MSFCRLTKGITPTICRLCVYVIINKRSFESFVCLDPVIYHQNLQNDEKAIINQRLSKPRVKSMKAFVEHIQRGNTGHLFRICVLRTSWGEFPV